MSEIIRVVTTVTLDVDATAWAEAYGTDVPAAIRADVKEYVRQSVTDWFESHNFLDQHGKVNA